MFQVYDVTFYLPRYDVTITLIPGIRCISISGVLFIKHQLNIIFIYKKTHGHSVRPLRRRLSVAQQQHPHRPIPAHTTDPQLHNLHMPIRWGDGAPTKEVHLFVLVSFNMHHFHVKDQIAVGWNDGTKTLVPVRHGTGDVQP